MEYVPLGNTQELGITLWDTANVYGGGTSEETVGRGVKANTSAHHRCGRGNASPTTDRPCVSV